MKHQNKKQQKQEDKQLTEKELRLARVYWYQTYLYADADKAIEPYLGEELLPFKPGQTGWLRRTREALLYSVNYVGEKMGKNRRTYFEYESREKTGSITLNTLAAAAEAMDCELVYAIRPKTKTVFSETIWQKILKTALKSNRLDVCDQRRLGGALGAVAKDLVADSKFREQNNWSYRRNL